MHWTKRLQRAVRQAAEQGDVAAPKNIRTEINVGKSNSTTASSSTQHVEINQTRGSRRTRRDAKLREATITIVEDRPTPAAPDDGRGAHPHLAEGIELIGEMEGSGFKEPPSLVRRSDGQVIQLTPLLYAVAAHADGQHSVDEIAREVGGEIGRTVTADNVEVLVDKKLRPLGVLAEADGSSPKAKKLDPLLALNIRAAVIPERLSNVLASIFRPLFWPPVLVAVIAALIAGDVWLFGRHGVAQAIRQGLDHPASFLPLFGAVVLSAAFHEIGHAAACRYGGGTPGKMGCGLYLAWPAFYTDVTDAYRLGKRGRLRTDLGGVYFNMIVILATFGIYAATGNETVLLLVVIQHFEIFHQLLPVVRLDGYYIVADLTGVPDLFARIRPILASLVPWKRADERVTVLRRWVRFAVTAWVLIVVPLLLLQLLMLLIHLPRIIGTAFASGTKQWQLIGDAFSTGHTWGGVAGIIQLVVLVLPIVGIVLMLANLGRRIVVGGWRKTTGKPVARAAFLAATGGAAALLLLAWLPKQNYRQIQPGERGTFGEGIAAVRQLPQGNGPLESQRRAVLTSKDQPSADAGSGPKTTTPLNPNASTTTAVNSTPTSAPRSTASTMSSVSTTPPRSNTTTAPSPTTTAAPRATTTSSPSTTTTSTSTTVPTTTTSAP